MYALCSIVYACLLVYVRMFSYKYMYVYLHINPHSVCVLCERVCLHICSYIYAYVITLRETIYCFQHVGLSTRHAS